MTKYADNAPLWVYDTFFEQWLLQWAFPNIGDDYAYQYTYMMSGP